MAPKAKKDAAAAAAAAAEAARRARLAQAEIMRDIKEGVFRGCVIPACYTLEEFAAGGCKPFPEFKFKARAHSGALHRARAYAWPRRRARMAACPQPAGPACGMRPTPPTPPAPNNNQNLKLATAEVGYGEDANAALSRRLWTTYFAGQPKLFEEVFGFPMSELPQGQTIVTMRIWRNEFIACCAHHRSGRLYANQLAIQSQAPSDRRANTLLGNVLLVSSSLKPEEAFMDGVRKDNAVALLRTKLEDRLASLEAAWRSPGPTLKQQYGWLADAPDAGAVPPPAQGAPAVAARQYVLSGGYKAARCMLPYRHALEGCTGWHIVKNEANTPPSFDVRRVPARDGNLVYSSDACPAALAAQAAAGAGSHPTARYFSCAKGAECTHAHSLIESLYSPEQYKRAPCDGARCPVSEAGAPVWCCPFYHDEADRAAAAAAAERAAPGVRPDGAEALAAAAAAAAGGGGGGGAGASTSGGQQQVVPQAREDFPSLAAAVRSVGHGTPAAAQSAASSSAATPRAAAGGAAAAAAAATPAEAEFGPEVLRFLFHGPEDGSSGALGWYYLDPDGNTHGPWSPEDMVDWTLAGQLPLEVRAFPVTADAPAPAAEHFMTISMLATIAAQTLLAQRAEAAPAAAEAPAAAAAAQAAPAAAVAAAAAPPPARADAAPAAAPIPVPVPAPVPMPPPAPAPAVPRAAAAAAAAAATSPGPGSPASAGSASRLRISATSFVPGTATPPTVGSPATAGSRLRSVASAFVPSRRAATSSAASSDSGAGPSELPPGLAAREPGGKQQQQQGGVEAEWSTVHHKHGHRTVRSEASDAATPSPNGSGGGGAAAAAAEADVDELAEGGAFDLLSQDGVDDLPASSEAGPRARITLDVRAYDMGSDRPSAPARTALHRPLRAVGAPAPGEPAAPPGGATGGAVRRYLEHAKLLPAGAVAAWLPARPADGDSGEGGAEGEEAAAAAAAARGHAPLRLLEDGQLFEAGQKLEVEVYLNFKFSWPAPKEDAGEPFSLGRSLLARLSHVTARFWGNLEDAVYGPPAGGRPATFAPSQALLSKPRVAALVATVCTVFEAAHEQGLLWRHDPDWLAVNTGLARAHAGEDGGATSNGGGGEAGGGGREIVLFLQRRPWRDDAKACSRPWVLAASVEPWSKVVEFVGGPSGVPPPPAVRVALAGGPGAAAAPPLAPAAAGRIDFDVPRPPPQQPSRQASPHPAATPPPPPPLVRPPSRQSSPPVVAAAAAPLVAAAAPLVPLLPGLAGAPLVHPILGAALAASTRASPTPVGGVPLVQPAVRAPLVLAAAAVAAGGAAGVRDLSAGLPGPRIELAISLEDAELSSALQGGSMGGTPELRVLVAAGTPCGQLGSAVLDWAAGLVGSSSGGAAAKLQQRAEAARRGAGALLCWREPRGPAAAAAAARAARVWGALLAPACGDESGQPLGPRLGISPAAADGAARRLDAQLWLPDSGGGGDGDGATAAAWPLLSRCVAGSPGRPVALAAAVMAEPDWWGPSLAHLEAALARAFERANEERGLVVVPAPSSSGSGEAEEYLVFNTGLCTRGLSSLFLLFTRGGGGSGGGGGRPWVLERATNGAGLSMLLGREQDLPPPPTPPAAAAAGFDAASSVAADWDALMPALGPAAPPAAALQGALEASLLLARRAPGLVLRCAGARGRALLALPLFLDPKQPVRLVLLLEPFGELSGGGGGGGAAVTKREYRAVQLVTFESAYGLMRAIGPVDWVAWVRDGLADAAARLAPGGAEAAADGELAARRRASSSGGGGGGGGNGRWLDALLAARREDAGSGGAAAALFWASLQGLWPQAG
ncbi:hypothetical protein Rsub_03417 [Raphidocelis subcapitata]|uniref:GYF domain-containing protein n=1 Tax=Raphidocelis subcapitata TaxID=307507 RepID=A0A2V0NS06_9CHLO|nr:hypothetical protein Rsub_03417 [Raphidocelis subcapitata]|eukprot:GBF90421.1 hypothetical protein Rsub_03417 [Raphidocelis subcapitata]